MGKEDPFTSEESRPWLIIADPNTWTDRETGVENRVLSRENVYQIPSLEHRKKEFLTKLETRLIWRDVIEMAIFLLAENRATLRLGIETFRHLRLIRVDRPVIILLLLLIIRDKETIVPHRVQIARLAEIASSITNMPIFLLWRHPHSRWIIRRIVKMALRVTRIVPELITTPITIEVAARASGPEVSNPKPNVHHNAKDRDLAVAFRLKKKMVRWTTKRGVRMIIIDDLRHPVEILRWRLAYPIVEMLDTLGRHTATALCRGKYRLPLQRPKTPVYSPIIRPLAISIPLKTTTRHLTLCERR